MKLPFRLRALHLNYKSPFLKGGYREIEPFKYLSWLP